MIHMEIQKFKTLLNDLEDLQFKDGYSSTRREYCDDEIVAESCLHEYKELAKKYHIPFNYEYNYDDYEYDYEFAEQIWIDQENLSWEIKKKIKKEIMKIIGDK